jgi:predicted SAM-dependent methyltransferase
MENSDRAAYEAVMQRRRERLFDGMSLAGLRGVEVGPLSRPVVRRHEAEVYYVDHCSTEDLRKKYAGDHAHIEGIQEVDFIWAQQPLVELIGDKAPLDFIVAAHVIEHVPDLCGWLREMSDALKVGGRLLLIIPDKRFTFDIYRRLSSFEEITQAWEERRRRPGLRIVLDHFANVVQADTSKLWENYSLADHLPYHHGADLLALAAGEHSQGKYIDVHCWVFTPWHFMHLMGRMVRELGVDFDLRYFLTTQGYDLEFYVQLEKTTTLTTDWAREAEKARRNALWPERMPDVPADGVLRQIAASTAQGAPGPWRALARTMREFWR